MIWLWLRLWVLQQRTEEWKSFETTIVKFKNANKSVMSWIFIRTFNSITYKYMNPFGNNIYDD